MSYKIITADSLVWLENHNDGSLGSFITGLPDMDEVNLNIEEYCIFFKKCAKLIFNKMSKNGYSIFIQTDRKINGSWFDKSYHLTNTAYECGLKLMWHKIVLQRPVGHNHLQRPTYSHMLCYSYLSKPSVCFPDVIDIGKKEYKNSTPFTGSEECANFIMKAYKEDRPIIDPFNGQGTIGLSVLKRGMNFIGIDIDPEQCKKCEEYLSKNLDKEKDSKGLEPSEVLKVLEPIKNNKLKLKFSKI